MKPETIQKLKDNGYPFEDYSLDKLKEACGNIFAKLWKDDNNKWIAGSYFMGIMPHKKDTPDEAIADLWLTYMTFLRSRYIEHFIMPEEHPLKDFKFDETIALRRS